MITDKVDLSTNQRCDCGLSQIIRLNVITFSALLNDGMTTYRSSHSTQFPFLVLHNMLLFLRFLLVLL